MHGRIVVGVDGSNHSRRALAYAFEEARRRDARVEVVHAYHLPPSGAAAIYGADLPTRSKQDLESEALDVIDRTMGSAPTDVEFERIATPGPVSGRLLRIADGADLLVVGSRGRGGFTGLLLGSVSHQVVGHATCPVIVVPALDVPPETGASPDTPEDER